MKILAKILQSQESGYSGDKPDQRGKYIIVGKEFWQFFPDLTTGIRNSFCSLRFNIKNKVTSCMYVWHNTKYFPELGLKRAHDERRLYRNKLIDDNLYLDRNVIIFFAEGENKYEFNLFSLVPGDTTYDKFIEVFGKSNFIFDDIEFFKSIDAELAKRIIESFSSKDNEIDNYDDLLRDMSKVFKDQELTEQNDTPRRQEYLGPIVEISDDPLMALKVSFKTQDEFKKAVRSTYKNRCAIRGKALVENDPNAIGLEAAHIHAKANGGNFLPSNGVLLSVDLHRAFDEGYWTLNDDLSVRVHESVKEGSLKEIDGMKIKIPDENKVFKPYYKYLQWHQSQRFGLFLRNQNQ